MPFAVPIRQALGNPLVPHDTGLKLGTVAEQINQSGGEDDWVNPNNSLVATDAAGSTSEIKNTALTYTLSHNTYGFALPEDVQSNVIITGFHGEVRVAANAEIKHFFTVVLDGAILGTWQAHASSPTSVTTLSWDVPDDLMGVVTALTAAQVNSAGFGFGYYAERVSGSDTYTTQVNWLKGGVRYTTGGEPPPPACDGTPTTYNSGSGSYLVLGQCNILTVECWGSGSSGTGERSSSVGGNGGGGGAYSKKVFYGASGSYNYSVGAGGAATSSDNGNAGNASWFGSNDANGCVAAGGDQSRTSGSGSCSGGRAADGHGDVKYSGGEGGNYNTVQDYACGGGGAAGENSDGDGAPMAGDDWRGGSATGSGGAGGDGHETGSTGDGQDGSAPGGAGGGEGAGGNNEGGAGANGRIKITPSIGEAPGIVLHYSEINSNVDNLTLPSDLVDGDIGVFIDWSWQFIDPATPTGWTEQVNIEASDDQTLTVCTKVLTAADSNAAVAGMANSDRVMKGLLVFRMTPDGATGFTIPVASKVTSDDGGTPAAHSVAGTFTSPYVVIAAVTGNSTANTFASYTPAPTGTVSAAGGGSGGMREIKFSIFDNNDGAQVDFQGNSPSFGSCISVAFALEVQM